jgi:hypothetical protein
MKVIFSSSALVASMLIAASVNATPFDGLYKSVHGTWTCTAEDIGLDGGSLGIQSNFLYGLESECELKNPTKVRGMDAVLYDTECTAEGESYPSVRVMIMRHDDGLYMVRDGVVGDWRSCP